MNQAMNDESPRFTIEEADAGKRLDSFIAESLAETSRSSAQKWISGGHVLVNKEAKKASYLVQAGDLVEIDPPEPDPVELLPEPMDLDILYEDDDLLAVNKPAGLVVHPGAGNPDGTLANGLLFHLRETSRSDTLRPGIVHRLDKDTSGLLIVAKNDHIHDRLSAQFQKRQVDKAYIALVFGHLDPRIGEIDLPIGRDIRSRTRISPRTARPRDALTRYEVLEYLPEFTLLEAYPRTGRTHQIRVHLQSRGFPIAGDETYGFTAQLPRIKNTRHRKAVRELNRLFLHSARLSIKHPRSGKQLDFVAPLPDELANLVEFLRE